MTTAEQMVRSQIGIAPRRIAVVRALYLGDLLLAVPALRSLRAGFPDAEITLIGLPWAASFADRFANYVDRFVPFAGYPGIDEVPVDTARTETFLSKQREYGYDLAIQMHGSGETSNPFILELGAAMTAGFVPHQAEPSHHPERPVCHPERQQRTSPRRVEQMAKERSFAAAQDGRRGIDISAPYPDDLHETERNLRLVSLLGCPADEPRLEFLLEAGDRAEANALLAGLDRPLIGVHPGAKHPSRRWRADRFAAVADCLAERFDGEVVITGGPDEVEVAEQVASQMSGPVTNLAGRTSVGGLAGVLNRLDVFISNDTGPAHIASALGTPTVVVFGPADLRRWEPRGLNTHVIVRDVACRPCGQVNCPIDHRCLDWISVDEVLDAATQPLRVRLNGIVEGSRCVA